MKNANTVKAAEKDLCSGSRAKLSPKCKPFEEATLHDSPSHRSSPHDTSTNMLPNNKDIVDSMQGLAISSSRSKQLKQQAHTTTTRDNRKQQQQQQQAQQGEIPDKAKRPARFKTAFMFYKAKNYAGVEKKLLETKIHHRASSEHNTRHQQQQHQQQVTAELLARWKKLTNDERTPYVVAAQQDYSRYHDEMRLFKKKSSTDRNNSQTRDKSNNDSAMSSNNSETRTTQPAQPETSRRLFAEWNDMCQEEQDNWKRKNRQAALEYKQKLQKWQEQQKNLKQGSLPQSEKKEHALPRQVAPVTFVNVSREKLDALVEKLTDHSDRVQLTHEIWTDLSSFFKASMTGITMMWQQQQQQQQQPQDTEVTRNKTMVIVQRTKIKAMLDLLTTAGGTGGREAVVVSLPTIVWSNLCALASIHTKNDAS